MNIKERPPGGNQGADKGSTGVTATRVTRCEARYHEKDERQVWQCDLLADHDDFLHRSRGGWRSWSGPNYRVPR